MGDSGSINVGTPFTRGAKENGWEEANSQDFKVRGPAYLKDKIKISSASPAFHLAGVLAIHSTKTQIARARTRAPRDEVSESAAHASVDTATLKLIGAWLHRGREYSLRHRRSTPTHVREALCCALGICSTALTCVHPLLCSYHTLLGSSLFVIA